MMIIHEFSRSFFTQFPRLLWALTLCLSLNLSFANDASVLFEQCSSPALRSETGKALFNGLIKVNLSCTEDFQLKNQPLSIKDMPDTSVISRVLNFRGYNPREHHKNESAHLREDLRLLQKVYEALSKIIIKAGNEKSLALQTWAKEKRLRPPLEDGFDREAKSLNKRLFTLNSFCLSLKKSNDLTLEQKNMAAIAAISSVYADPIMLLFTDSPTFQKWVVPLTTPESIVDECVRKGVAFKRPESSELSLKGVHDKIDKEWLENRPFLTGHTLSLAYKQSGQAIDLARNRFEKGRKDFLGASSLDYDSLTGKVHSIQDEIGYGLKFFPVAINLLLNADQKVLPDKSLANILCEALGDAVQDEHRRKYARNVVLATGIATLPLSSVFSGGVGTAILLLAAGAQYQDGDGAIKNLEAVGDASKSGIALGFLDPQVGLSKIGLAESEHAMERFALFMSIVGATADVAKAGKIGLRFVKSSLALKDEAKAMSALFSEAKLIESDALKVLTTNKNLNADWGQLGTAKFRQLVNRSAPKKVYKLNQGNNPSYIVELENGMTGVFKPRQLAADRGVNSKIQLVDPHNEIVSQRVDEIFGLNIVPLTTIKKMVIGGEEVEGSFMLFRGGTHRGVDEISKNVLWESRLKPSEAVKLDLLDYLIENSDRNRKNFLVTDSGEAVAIDNGISFWQGEQFGGFRDVWLRRENGRIPLNRNWNPSTRSMYIDSERGRRALVNPEMVKPYLASAEGRVFLTSLREETYETLVMKLRKSAPELSERELKVYVTRVNSRRLILLEHLEDVLKSR